MCDHCFLKWFSGFGVSDMMIGFCSQLELIRVTASETMEAYIILCNLDDGQEEQERKRFLPARLFSENKREYNRKVREIVEQSWTAD
ncbi:unnamed protein product [Coffea canephora]|uniref:DH200=94 genomic scaffold, scaffold_885 n=1 Tax=Coffea canephora TaxID=49390 RepID=A0A068VHA1_COFCA|nr:unnamed protein product [Coffea canephora]